MAFQVRNVLVTGGAGYVGAVLVPKLLEAGLGVSVLDLYLYGEDALASVRGHPNLRETRGDLRDPLAVAESMKGCDAVIHLACISNDPFVRARPGFGQVDQLRRVSPVRADPSKPA